MSLRVELSASNRDFLILDLGCGDHPLTADGFNWAYQWKDGVYFDDLRDWLAFERPDNLEIDRSFQQPR